MTNNTQKNTPTTDLVFHISYEDDQSLENGMKKVGVQIEHEDCGDKMLDRFADVLGTIVADFLERYPEAVANFGIEISENASEKQDDHQ